MSVGKKSDSRGGEVVGPDDMGSSGAIVAADAVDVAPAQVPAGQKNHGHPKSLSLSELSTSDRNNENTDTENSTLKFEPGQLRNNSPTGDNLETGVDGTDQESDWSEGAAFAVLEDETFYRNLRLVYYSGFNPELVQDPFQPQAPFIAADRWNMSMSDSNWYAWWDERQYFLLETIRLIWKEESTWVGRSISLFKKRGLAKFRFQAGTDVIQTETQTEATQELFELFRRFACTDLVLEIDLANHRMSKDGVRYVRIVQAREAEAFYTALENGLPRGQSEPIEVNLARVDPEYLTRSRSRTEVDETM